MTSAQVSSPLRIACRINHGDITIRFAARAIESQSRSWSLLSFSGSFTSRSNDCANASKNAVGTTVKLPCDLLIESHSESTGDVAVSLLFLGSELD